jgi:hypothetical protein
MDKAIMHFRKREMFCVIKTACGVHLSTEFNDDRKMLIIHKHYVDMLATTDKEKVTCDNCKRTKYFLYE